ncbi:uncharacterized protein LOC132620168 [Lycium barbarum]|uniref:uncharacterized protein LOC132620168 n=1 Tax=Lycium barbarum TaxID=112863 RepID=UPI00293E4752|nr:uncharacterized protein LOC132620168 [Lycium barbarum]
MWDHWERVNAIVLSWVMNAVSKNLLRGIMYATSAQVVWQDLCERFNKIDGSRTYNLHKEIATLNQDTTSVSVYFSKLKSLWVEFESMVPAPGCNCSKLKAFVEHLQKMKLFQFLMGLNDAYSQARSQILMMNPMPNVNQAYSLVISDESQKAVAANSGILGTNPSATVGNIDLAMYSRNNVSQNNVSQGGSNQYGHQKFKKPYNSLICDFCKCKGHTKDTCFKLAGYPSDFKSKKGVVDRKTGQSQRYGAAYNVVGESSNMDLGPVNTQNYNVQQAFVPYNMNGASFSFGHGNNMGGYGSQNGQVVSSANAAGDIAGMVEDMALVATDNNSPEWIIDTGATNHMASDAKLLNQDTISEPVIPKRVHFPNGDITQVSHIGTSSISKNNTISNVFLDLFTGRVKEIGREEAGLYLLLNQHTYNGKHISLAIDVKSSIDNCTICPCAKQTRLPFQPSQIKTSDRLEMFFRLVKNQYDKTIKVIRTDNGSEFLNNTCITMFQELGIIHQRTCVYTPQKNGVVERKHRHILEVTRAMRIQAHIPIEFWGHCILAAVYVINRLPTEVLNGVSPYERFHAKQSNISHLRVLGCLCFAKDMTQHDKMQSRLKPAIHMGYSDV